MLESILPIAAIIAVLFILVLLQVIKLLGRARFKLLPYARKPLEDIPLYRQHALGHLYQELAPLGFEPFAYATLGDNVDLGLERLDGAVFFHPGQASYAVAASLSEDPDRGVVIFVTFTRAGRRISSWPGNQLNWICQADDEVFNRVDALAPKAIWEDHIRLLETEAPPHERATGDLDWFFAREEAVLEKAVADTRQRGLLTDEGRLKFRPMLKIALQALGRENTYQAKTAPERKTLATPDFDDETRAALQVDAYERHLKLQDPNDSGNVWLKLVLLIGSMAAFFVAFNQTMSWESALILLLVVGFHEAGHIVAMKLCGYRDLKVLFIPFLGAAAMGQGEEYVSPWKRLVVYFAGPLPGIALGMILWVYTLYAGGSTPVLDEAIWILLFLNLFNLLPFLPLDGGRIVSLTLFSRFPILQTIMLGLSGMALGLLAMLAGSPILGVIALFMILGIPGHYQRSDLLAKLRYTWPNNLDRADRRGVLRHLFKGMIGSPLAKQKFAKRVQHARQIFTDLVQPAASALTVLASLFVYFSPIWMALLLVVPIHFIGGHRERAAVAEARAAGIPVEATELERPELPENQNAAALLFPLIETASDYQAEDAPVQELYRLSFEIGTAYAPEKMRIPRGFDEIVATPEAQEILEAIEQGRKRPGFEWTPPAEGGAGEDHLGSEFTHRYYDYGAIGQLMFINAAQAFEQGDIDGAYRVVMDILSVGQVFRRSSTPDAFFGSFGYGDIAASLQASLSLADADPSPEVYRELQEAWAQYARHDLAHLDLVLDRQRLERSNEDYMIEDWGPMYWLTAFYTINSEQNPINRALALSRYDRAHALSLVNEFRGFQPSPGVFDERLQERIYQASYVFDQALEVLFSLQQVEYDVTNDRVTSGLARTALALYAFKQAEGAYPETLAELVPRYLPAELVDPYVGEPFGYLRIGDEFELYSAGEQTQWSEAELADFEMWGLEEADFQFDSRTFWHGRDAIVPETDY